MSKLSIIGEISKKYYDSVIRLRQNTDAPVVLFRVSQLNVDQDCSYPSLYDVGIPLLGYVYNVDKGVWDKTTIQLEDWIVDVSTPNAGYRNDERTKTARYFSVNMRRQWKRGVNSSRVYASGDTNLTNDTSLQQYYLFMLEPTYPAFAEAVEKMCTGEYNSVAFAAEYAIGYAFDTDALFLLYKNIPCGVVSYDDYGYMVRLTKRTRYMMEDIEQYARCAITNGEDDG